MNFLRSFYFSYLKYFLLSVSGPHQQPPRSLLSPRALAQHHAGFSGSAECQQQAAVPRRGPGRSFLQDTEHHRSPARAPRKLQTSQPLSPSA